MLIQFRFQNFKSFRDETILDMSATKVSEYPHHISEIGNEKILKTAAIYGANASGKTNVYHALHYMSYYVINSFSFGGENDAVNSGNYAKTEPFLFDSASKDKDSIFEIYFTINGDDKTYNYGFSVNNTKVTEEWLNYKTRTGRRYKKIIYRGEDEIDLSGIPEKHRENIKVSLHDETLIVSLGAKLKVEKLEKIYKWFGSIIFLDFGNPVTNFISSMQLPIGFAENESVRKNVVAFLSKFDKGITDFEVEEVKREDNKIGYSINAIHKTIDSDKKIPIPLMNEAAGTQKMFAMYTPLKIALENGGILFIDELNDRLHPLLVRNFIQTFINPETNQNNAQLIFTTHDAWLLNSDLFRRDEIWFTEKGDDSASKLYSLVEFKGEDRKTIRKDENYEKNYMMGKYGAIPNLEVLCVNETKTDYDS